MPQRLYGGGPRRRAAVAEFLGEGDDAASGERLGAAPRRLLQGHVDAVKALLDGGAASRRRSATSTRRPGIEARRRCTWRRGTVPSLSSTFCLSAAPTSTRRRTTAAARSSSPPRAATSTRSRRCSRPTPTSAGGQRRPPRALLRRPERPRRRDQGAARGPRRRRRDGQKLPRAPRRASNGHVDAIKALLEAHADVDAVNHYGFRALHLAKNGHGAIKALLEAHADVDAVNRCSDPRSTSPPRTATSTRSRRCSRPADVDAANNNGDRAFDLAVKNGPPPRSTSRGRRRDPSSSRLSHASSSPGKPTRRRPRSRSGSHSGADTALCARWCLVGARGVGHTQTCPNLTRRSRSSR